MLQIQEPMVIVIFFLKMAAEYYRDIAFDGASATVIPFGDEIGRATSLNIIEHGINYTSAPSFAFPHYAVLKTVSGAVYC